MGSKPKSPDYRGAAEEQAQASKEVTRDQTYANRPDQYSPWGSVKWTPESIIDPSTGKRVTKWAQRETLDPRLQQTLDSEIGLQQGRYDLASGMLDRVQGEFADPMDWGKFGDQQGLEYDPTQLRQRAEDAVYNKAADRINPDFERKQQAMEIKLRNQGLRPGDQAWDAQMSDLETSRSDALERARQDAVTQGRGEAAQDYQQQMGSSQYANQLRQQAIKEEMTKRGYSLNEINAIISGQQVANPQFESFTPAQRSETPQYLQAATNQGNFDMGAQSGLMSGLSGLAGSAASMYGGYLGSKK